MHNALTILRINRTYRYGGMEKWRKILIAIGILMMLTSIFFMSLPILHTSSTMSSPTSFMSIMSMSCIILMFHMIEGFVPQRIMDGTNSRKIRDLRNHYVYMPFEFSDYIMAGYISLMKNFLISCVLFTYYVALTSISNSQIITKGWIGFAVLINIITYLVLGASYLGSYIKNKSLNKIMPKIYVFSVFIWLLALALSIVSGLIEFKVSALAPLCSLFGIILSLAFIPLMYALTKLTIIKNKGRSWFNE